MLVPGFGGDDSMLLSLADRLHRAGRTTVLLAIPNDATGDLRGQADLLGAKVRALLKAGAPSVDLVGYSAGGIVVGLFVAAHPQDVRRIVTLGSPLHGTRLAQFAAGLAPATCPIACQQMVPGTSVLLSLDAAVPARTGVPWLSMWTTHDEVVLPADSARFDGAVNIAAAKCVRRRHHRPHLVAGRPTCRRTHVARPQHDSGHYPHTERVRGTAR